jgi:hypothetical protein
MLMRALRALLMYVLALLMVGTGMCGAMGVVVGLLGGARESSVFLVYGAVGLLVAWGCWAGMAAIRRARARPGE